MNIFKLTGKKLSNQGLRIDRFDFKRPWGGFFVLDEKQAQEFADIYFEGLDVGPLRIGGKLSPKILLVKPKARLSWQYHHRRAETWRVVEGPVGIVRSVTNKEGELVSCEAGEIIVLRKGERHRLIGLENWGVVAEFWQHTDPVYPSDEDDIVRIQDDYARK
jgi:mannose-6-phosphate isomerase-like protein (cupin superfamily)